MDFFERYLHAVRNALPKGQQDDVVRELSEELRSQAEEREAELGRPLTSEEQQQILKQWGHPLLLAARYQPKRHVIGPTLFPVYWFVLRIALGVTLLVHVINAVIVVAQGQPFGAATERLFRMEPLLLAFAWVTVVFAFLDRVVLRLPALKDWDPTSLPIPKHTGAPSWWCRVAELVMGIAIVFWLAALPHNQWLMFGPAHTMIALGPAWFDVHMLMVLLACASVVVMAFLLRRPDARVARSLSRVVMHVAWMVIIMYVLKSHDVIVAAASKTPGSEALAELLNTIARVGLAVALIVIAFETVREGIRLMERTGWWSRWSPRQG